MWHVYGLYNGKSIYVGITKDLKRRIKEHKSGKAHTTKRMGNLRLIYVESFCTRKDAQEQERFYKTGYGREVLRKKLKNTLNS